MNDEEIKKALKDFYHRAENTNLSYHIFESEREALKEALAIINRQQAEIERLNGNLFTISSACMQRVNEAIKEFAERLKEKQRTFIGDEYAYEYIPSIEIDVLLAEKAGEQDEKENICI